MTPLIKPTALIKETWQSFLKTWDVTVRYSAFYLLIAAASAANVYLKNRSGGTEFLSAILQIIIGIGSLYLSIRLYKLSFYIEDRKPVVPLTSAMTWKIMAQTLISILIIIIPIILSAGIIAALIATGLAVNSVLPLAILASVAFVLAIIYFLGVRFGFAQIRIVDEPNGAIEAYKYSWKITKNRFWPIFGRMMLGGLVFGGFFMAILLVAFLLISLVSGVDLPSALSSQNPSPPVLSTAEIVQGIVMAAILPLFYLFKVKLYRDIEKAKS